MFEYGVKFSIIIDTHQMCIRMTARLFRVGNLMHLTPSHLCKLVITLALPKCDLYHVYPSSLNIQ